jgi:esterase/lipase/1-acyl-sn-glycerol-3-phosphate acyltransferase
MKPDMAKFKASSLDRERRLGPQFKKPGVVRYARQATGVVLSWVESVMASRISVQGTNNIPDGPVLFVANHFTRSETFILPYLIDRYARRTALSLAHWGLFKGLFGDFLRTIGALPTRHPNIKHRIVEDLFTGRSDWLIYPEGAMIKNKKVWRAGRFHLETPDREGSPHTGSAVLALQVIIYRELYARALREDDHEALAYYRKFFRIEEDLPEPFHIIPINISYYPIRPGPNIAYRLARLLIPQLPKTLEEELSIEGNLLFKDTDITVYFGKPIQMERYRTLLRPGLAEIRHGDDAAIREMIEALKHRLTNRLMGEVYRRLTINIDHLVCSTIRHRRRPELLTDDLRAIIYLAARDIQSGGDRRIHRTIDGTLLDLLTGANVPALAGIRKLAVRTGAVIDHGNRLTIDANALQRRHTFHDIRIKNPIGVIANELEPLREAVQAVRSVVNLPSQHLRARIVDLLVAEDLIDFERDRQAATAAHAAGEQPDPKPRDLCSPFLIGPEKGEVGIVLSHGYLAAPQEVRHLAEYLAEEGFVVYGPRLKGHGSVPGHLATVDYQDWQASFDRAVAIMSHRCRHVIVAGFSAGALLALRAAVRPNPRIIGAISINPAIRLQDPASRVVPSIVTWNRLLQKVSLNRGRFEWIENRPEFPDVNYTRNYLNGIWQLQRLIRATRADLPSLRIPVLTVQGDADPVVDPKGTRAMVAQIGSEEKEFAMISAKRHGILRGEGSAVVFERVTEWARRIAHRHQPLHPEPDVETESFDPVTVQQ